ncbi:MAG: hypothetical protein ACRD68_04740 [Pyrinomonadaceae bacterium]
MNKGALVWMIVFAASALCFFVVAAVVSVKGFGDLMDLLRGTERAGRGEGDAPESRGDGL